MSTNEIAAKVKLLKEYKRMIEEAEAEVKAIEDIIKAEMGDSETMIAGEYKIRYTKVASNRFDTSAFKKDQPDLYAQYTKQSESLRFSIN